MTRDQYYEVLKLGIIGHKHGFSHHSVYKIWKYIKSRCFNVNVKEYCNYGGRGITMCNEWKENPRVFCEWALANGYQEGLEINRTNNDGNYEPSNCEWVTHWENSQNKRLLGRKNKSGYHGVSRCKNRWHATSGLNYKSHFLGSFKTPEEAALVYNQFVIKNNLPRPLNIIPNLQKTA